MQADESLDCFGLMCPMPIIKTAQAVKKMKMGQVLEVRKLRFTSRKRGNKLTFSVIIYF